MGWAIGYDSTWYRDIGYGVPAVCDHPRCNTQIDRGLAFVCGGQPYGGEDGCGLYFCAIHLYYTDVKNEYDADAPQLCERCLHDWELGSDHWRNFWPAFEPKRDIMTWVRWKLRDASWAEWRKNHEAEVRLLRIRCGEVAA